MTLRPLSRSLKADLITQVQGYQEQLQAAPEAMEYLVGRGLTEKTIADAALGYVSADGEGPAQGHEKFVGRIVIPYLTTSGPVKLRFRALGETTGAKYLDMPGAKTRLYNVLAIANDPIGDRLYICEGEFDTLIAQQVGLTAVGLPGATAWQPHFRQVLEGYDRVVILGDHDDKPSKGSGLRPAEEMAQTVATELKNADVRPVYMPEGHDVNSAYLEGGKQNLLDWINGNF